jgi:hypothetical protein
MSNPGENNSELDLLMRLVFRQACYDAEDTARLLGISGRQLQVLVRRGALRKFSLGTRRTNFLSTDLAAFVVDRLRETNAQSPPQVDHMRRMREASARRRNL